MTAARRGVPRSPRRPYAGTSPPLLGGAGRPRPSAFSCAAHCSSPSATLAGVLGAPPAGAATTTAKAATIAHTVFGTSWPVYHHDGTREAGPIPPSTEPQPGDTGVDVARPWTARSTASRSSRRVASIVATENDTVYELAANTGAVLWSTHVGTAGAFAELFRAVTSRPPSASPARPSSTRRAARCSPSPTRPPGRARSTTSWASTSTRVPSSCTSPSSLPGSDQLAELQRTGLALDDGNVVAGFGGNDGDCGNYHGWVVAIPEGGGAQQSFEVASAAGDSQGAVWMGGAAPVVDGQGNIWVTTGNSAFESVERRVRQQRRRHRAVAVAARRPVLRPDHVVQRQRQRLRLLHVARPWCRPTVSSSRRASPTSGTCCRSRTWVASAASCSRSVRSAAGTSTGGRPSRARRCTSRVKRGSSPWPRPTPNSADACCGTPTPAPAGLPSWPEGSCGPSTPAATRCTGSTPAPGTTVQQFALGSESNHFPTPTVADGLLLAPSSNAGARLRRSRRAPAGTPLRLRPGRGTGRRPRTVGCSASAAPGFAGSLGRSHLEAPVVGMTATTDGDGYWLVASDGGVFAFGDAGYFGSMGGRRVGETDGGDRPVPDGDGYWTVASDGGVFAFGGARYFGSMGGRHLDRPVVGIASTADGGGYWLVASDGGVFSFGDAAVPGVDGWTATRPTRRGHGGGALRGLLVGGVRRRHLRFGGAGFFGSMGGRRLDPAGGGDDPDVGRAGLLGWSRRTAGSSRSATHLSRAQKEAPGW